MKAIGTTKDEVHDRTGLRRIVSAAATPQHRRRHPAIYQSCTRLKLSRAAGGLGTALQQSARVMGGAPERNKNSKQI